ncbi:MAG: hypothetical protein QOI21_5073 [Actinomycetota bacterium]|jgi:hypothetical protein|nr:hypothetical protein [Actinomycetota bacterium]
MASDLAKGKRRLHGWPAGVLATLFGVCGIYFAIALEPVIGVSGNTKSEHPGTAEVQTCESSELHLGMVDRCRASIRWDDGSPGRDDYNIIAARPISGSVRVDYFGLPRSTAVEILPVDRPRFASTGTYVLLTFVGVVLLAGVGGFLGYLLARLLPEPPLPVKKFRRGVTRRANPGFNGPRRRKRG